jgi:hypothetical protein
MSMDDQSTPVPESKSGVIAGLRPDITPAQDRRRHPDHRRPADSWGVYTLTQAQQDSLSKAVTWAIALVGGDALIRLGRNLARR